MQGSDRLSVAAAELREFARAGLRIDSFGRRLQLLERATVLSALPAVRAAGSDATARFEYLVQAINDAIDDLSRTGEDRAGGPGHTAPPAVANGHHPEAAALRQLFGLGEETRRASWRVRQDRAAAALHVSWDHFRHHRQSMLLRALTERLLAPGRADRPHFPATFSAFPPAADVETEIVAYIHTHRPPRADLLELSTATMLPVLRALRDVGSAVRLLVADPRRLPSTPFMSERIDRALTDLMAEFGALSLVDIRVYGVPPSLRGRRIGSLIAVGWYTYRDNKRLDPSEGGTTEIWGHDNALVVGEASDVNGATLAAWFGREFDRLWEHRLTRGSSGLLQ